MTITTDRDAEIDFSIPYYIAEGRVLAPVDSDITGGRGPGGEDGVHGHRFDVRGEPQAERAGG